MITIIYVVHSMDTYLGTKCRVGKNSLLSILLLELLLVRYCMIKITWEKYLVSGKVKYFCYTFCKCTV